MVGGGEILSSYLWYVDAVDGVRRSAAMATHRLSKRKPAMLLRKCVQRRMTACCTSCNHDPHLMWVWVKISFTAYSTTSRDTRCGKTSHDNVAARIVHNEKRYGTRFCATKWFPAIRPPNCTHYWDWDWHLNWATAWHFTALHYSFLRP